MRTWRSTIGVAMALALMSSLEGAPSLAQSSSPPPCTAEAIASCGDDAVILKGTISGTNTYHGPGPLTDDYEGLATMDVTIVMTPNRASASGMAAVSGTYSGDCEFSHAENVAIDWDSHPDPDWTFHPVEGRPAFAVVEVFTSDPRFAERPLTGFYLSVGAGTGGEGGTCGHETGKVYPVTDVDFPMRVDLLGCSFFEVLSMGRDWHGECREGEPTDERHWTADLAQVDH